MRLKERISGFSYFCVVPTALCSLIPSYPALKRWAKLRRPLRGLFLYFPHQIFQDISRCPRCATLPRTPKNPALTCWAIEITSLRDLEKTNHPHLPKKGRCGAPALFWCRRFATPRTCPSNPALTCWAIDITSLRDSRAPLGMTILNFLRSIGGN